jgi:hypothetical protein
MGGTHSPRPRNEPACVERRRKIIQAILRHISVGLTMNVYVKSVSESQVAMDALSEKFESCNVLATPVTGKPN